MEKRNIVPLANCMHRMRECVAMDTVNTEQILEI